MNINNIRILQRLSSRALCKRRVKAKSFHLWSSVVYSQQSSPGTTHEAGEFLSGILDGSLTGSIFAGTGQYYQAKGQDRILVINFAEDFLADPDVALFDAKTILDCSMKTNDVDLFMKNVRSISNLPIYNGEVDFINISTWAHGFTLKPFSIFSGDERLCFLKEKNLHISNLGNAETIDILNIKFIGLSVSDEPYNERKLFLGLKDQENKMLIEVETKDEHCDLATLTVGTEWMLKAAALLCVNLTRRGNKDVHLRISPALQPANNQWVAMRQKIWIDMIQKNTVDVDS